LSNSRLVQNPRVDFTFLLKQEEEEQEQEQASPFRVKDRFETGATRLIIG